MSDKADAAVEQAKYGENSNQHFSTYYNLRLLALLAWVERDPGFLGGWVQVDELKKKTEVVIA